MANFAESKIAAGALSAAIPVIPNMRPGTILGGLTVGLIVALPLAGAWLGEQEVGRVFVFPPPLDIPTNYPRFSWAAVAAVVFALTVVFLPWLRPHERFAARSGAVPAPTGRPGFPWWGIAALIWTGGWWVLAWTRFPWFEPFQLYTFFPLWMGFIVAVNAATFARTGSCLMLRAPSRWLSLFAVGMLGWWLFEWLNRFVRNWHYLNVQHFGPVAYALHASICFATVLPAVSSVAEWLSTHHRLVDRLRHGPAWRWLAWRGSPLLLLTGGIAAMLATGAYPIYWYPALWLGPLALVFGAALLTRRNGVPRELARGDWVRAGTWMLAALLCGWFWELWNWRSLAHWVYTVPGVERWHVFEMPLLGYAGYLPFGVECLLVADWLLDREQRPGIAADGVVR